MTEDEITTIVNEIFDSHFDFKLVKPKGYKHAELEKDIKTAIREAVTNLDYYKD